MEEAVNMTNVLFSLDSLTRKAKTSADGNGDFGQKLFRVYQKLESSPLPFPEPLKCFLLDLENRKATLKQRERKRERERERDIHLDWLEAQIYSTLSHEGFSKCSS